MRKCFRFTVAIGLFIVSNVLYAQTEISGVVRDALNGSRIPYAKLWFIDNGVVFSCDGKGEYCFVLPKNMRKEKVAIECYGYASDTLMARQLMKNSTVELSPLPRELRVVTVRPQQTPLSVLAEAFARVEQNFHADTTIGLFQDFRFATLDGKAYLKQQLACKLMHYGYDESRIPAAWRKKLIKKYLKGRPVKDYIEKEYLDVDSSLFWADTMMLRKYMGNRYYWPIAVIEENLVLTMNTPINPPYSNWVARYALYNVYAGSKMEMNRREDSSMYYTIYLYDSIGDDYRDTTEYHVEYPSMAISYGSTCFKETEIKPYQKMGFVDRNYYDTVVVWASAYYSYSKVDGKYALDSMGCRYKRNCQVADKADSRRYYPKLIGTIHHYDLYYKRKRLDLHRKAAGEQMDSIIPPKAYEPVELQPWMVEAMQQHDAVQ